MMNMNAVVGSSRVSLVRFWREEISQQLRIPEWKKLSLL